jgi:multidrug efflux pump subunit AcrA (membrane-fusion protein)
MEVLSVKCKGRSKWKVFKYFALLCALHFALFTCSTSAQGIRDRIRGNRDKATSVNEAQASELTLTVTTVEVRPIQVWVRAAGTGAGQVLRAVVSKEDARFIKPDQRVRAFPPEHRSSMFQARVTQVVPGADRAEVVVTLVAPGLKGSSRYVLEIVTEHGNLLSVPNEAIIETGDKRVVYVQGSGGNYAQREVDLGVQGELFTEVVKGLMPGEQVVTFGSFFIDADHKLKGS